MYTNCEDVDKIVIDFLGGVSIDEIFAFSQDLRINKKQIVSLVLQEAEKCGYYTMNEDKCLEIFDIYYKTLKIYKNKCILLARAMQVLAGTTESSSIVQYFDLTIKDGKVLTSDIKRILLPLKRNYELARSAQIKIQSVEDYLNENYNLITKKKFPNSSVLNGIKKHSDEAVEMTARQVSITKERRKNLAHALLSSSLLD